MAMVAETVFTESEERGYNVARVLEQEKKKDERRNVAVFCVLEIPQNDLDSMNDQTQEFDEARRSIEAGLRHLNLKTQLLDPDWEGWHLKSFVVGSASR
jgi:hypothetical protein